MYSHHSLCIKDGEIEKLPVDITILKGYIERFVYQNNSIALMDKVCSFEEEVNSIYMAEISKYLSLVVGSKVEFYSVLTNI